MTTRKKKENKDKSQADFKEFSITRKLKNTNARIKNNEQGDLQVGGTIKQREALEQDYTIIDNELNDLLTGITIYNITIGDNNSNKENNLSIAIFEKLGLGRVTSVGPDGDIGKANLKINDTKHRLAVNDIILLYKVKGSEYIYIHNKEFFDNTKNGSVTINFIKYDDLNSDIENKIKERIKAKIELDQVVKDQENVKLAIERLAKEEQNKEAEDKESLAKLTKFIQDKHITIDEVRVGSSGFKFSTHQHNGAIANIKSGSMKGAGLEVGDIIVAYKFENQQDFRKYKKDDLKKKDNELFYEDSEHYKLPVDIKYIKKNNLDESKKTSLEKFLSNSSTQKKQEMKPSSVVDSTTLAIVGTVADLINQKAPATKEATEKQEMKPSSVVDSTTLAIVGTVADLINQKAPEAKEATQKQEMKPSSVVDSTTLAIVGTVADLINQKAPEAKEATQKQEMKPSSLVDSTTLAIVGTVADLINQKAPEAKETPDTKEATQKQEMKPSSLVDSTTLAIVGTVADLINQKAPATKEAIQKLIADCEKFKNEFETFKKNKTKDENELMKIMKIINELLNNKQTLDRFEKQQKSDLYEIVTNAIQTYTKLINEIMSYLNDNFSMKYQWIEIVDSKDPIYNRKTGIINKLYKNSNDGLWTFEVWIPQPNKSKKYWSVRARANEISLINEPTAVNKTLQVKTISGEIIETYVTGNIIVNSSRFLVDKKYDITNEVNYQPDITNANNKVLLGKNFMSDTYSGVVTEPITDLVKGTVRAGDKFIKDKSKRGLREELKKYIGSIIDNDKEFKGDEQLLKKIIRFENTKQSIRTVLVNKISHIFSEGETRFNLFNKESLKKNFADDNNNITEEDEERKEGGLQEGGGIYGFRNFDKHDAKKFLIFILTNLKLLIDGKNKFSNNIKNLLLTTYLKTLFSKIDPPELNKLLPDIDNTQAASKHVINHFIGRLKKNSDTVKAGEAAETNGLEHAEEISKLNFELKRNVKSFMSAIVDIALHTDELTGTKEKIADYLDKEYDKAMNIPFGDDKTRIENLEINNALREILGSGLNSIKGYRTKIKEIDDLIDSITVKNISEKINALIPGTILPNTTLENGKIFYKLPDKFQKILQQNIETEEKAATEEATTRAQLDEVKELVKEVLAKDSFEESKKTDKFKRLKELIGSPASAPAPAPTAVAEADLK
jgi:hypothetical protein